MAHQYYTPVDVLDIVVRCTFDATPGPAVLSQCLQEQGVLGIRPAFPLLGDGVWLAHLHSDSDDQAMSMAISARAIAQVCRRTSKCRSPRNPRATEMEVATYGQHAGARRAQ